MVSLNSVESEFYAIGSGCARGLTVKQVLQEILHTVSPDSDVKMTIQTDCTWHDSPSLCSATRLVNAGYSIEMRPTQSVLRRSAGSCILLQRCGKRDFLSIRVRKKCEINAITRSTMKREVQSLKSELRALRTGHLSASEVRLSWTPEE